MAWTPKKKQDGIIRRGRAAAVGQDATASARDAFARAGFADPSLVLHWPEIVGPEIARIAQPVRFAQGAAGGVLTLLAEPGAALFLGHESRALAQRINAYLGSVAVTRVKFVQGAIHPRPAPNRPPRPASAPGANDPALRFQGPEELAQALQKLASWRTTGR